MDNVLSFNYIPLLFARKTFQNSIKIIKYRKTFTFPSYFFQDNAPKIAAHTTASPNTHSLSLQVEQMRSITPPVIARWF